MIHFCFNYMIINIQNIFYDPKNMLEELSGMSSYKKKCFPSILGYHENDNFHEISIFSYDLYG